MSKPLFNITNSHMARRVFRRTKSAAQLPASSDVVMADTEGIHQLCSHLSQEDIEKLSNFRGEANMLQAQMNRDAIGIEEALSYLRACHFSTPKAIEIFKNYQKSRETLHLEDLRPYREPLCSGIGARKMEVVGTRDSEGYPIVLFTVCRHETFKSDHKTDMQLLFYTLDQAFESEVAREKGIVFIIDFRDSHMSDIRYVSSVVSVLKEGYPIHTKMIYLVSTKTITKIITAFQKMAKLDLNKMKIVDFAELGSYFTPEQLPLSLGGTYTHRTTSPTHPHPPHSGGLHHRRVDIVKDDSSVEFRRSPQPSFRERTGSDGSRGKEARHVPHPSSNGGGGRSVNRLLELFESGSDAQTSANKPPPASPIKQRPVPPSKLNKPGKKGLSTEQPSSQQQGGGQAFQQVGLKKTPQEHTHTVEQQAGESQQGAKFQQMLKKAQSQSSEAGKVPLMPPNGRSNLKVGKSNSVEPLTVRGYPPSPSPRAANSKPLNISITKPPNNSSKPPNSRGKAAESSVSSVFSKFLKKGGTPNDHPKTTRGQSSDNLTKSCNPQSSLPDVLDRRRADSAGEPRSSLLSKSGAFSASSHPKKPVVTPYAESKKQGIPRSGSDGSGSKAAQKRTGVGYENVSPKLSHNAPQIKPPAPQHSLSKDEQDYENLSFTNRDSDVYENFGIGFAGAGGNISGPLPPLPPTKQSAATPAKSTYENIEISKSSARNKASKEKVVEEDDDTLFGKEGPPGMQETIYENFGPDKANRQMSIEELAAHVEKLGKKGLATEYLRVRNEPVTGAHKTCKLPGNTPKNRYKDVICYDETRVQLSGKDDYIHANYVDGYKKPNAFILTQGPKDKTVADFWRMVWEKHVLVIVMVTKCVELGKKKCAQYWPESGAPPAKHGGYTVAVSKLQNCEGYDLTHLQVSFKGVERSVLHFQFLAWPDYGIPDSGSSIVRLIMDVRSAQEKACRASPGPHPIVVHCSAGVGRSGAFCSIDNCIHELDEQKKVNFQGALRKMRKQRAFAVQTEEQYEFCYRTLLEYAKR